MTYQEAREYLFAIEQMHGSKPGLEMMNALVKKLGHPEIGLPVIHVAGTNGKGSVLAFLESILRECNYHTVRYSSPSVFHYLERLTENGEMISEEKFAALTGEVKAAADALVKEGIGQPTVFELETAMAFLFAKETKCDFMLLETGMGGRLDATNVVPQVLCSIITSISKEHTAFLGDTPEAIALEKAGIMKNGCPTVISAHNQMLAQVFEDAAIRADSPLTWGAPTVPYAIGLLGSHQPGNAGAAYAAIDILRNSGYDIPESAVVSGFQHTCHPGRFEKICDNPICVLDGAHNPDAALRLRETLLELTQKGELPSLRYFVLGIFKDKEYEEIVRLTASLAEQIFTVTPSGPRGLDAETLAEYTKAYNANVYAVYEIEKAVQLACRQAEANGGMVLCFGSLSFLGKARAEIEKWRK